MIQRIQTLYLLLAAACAALMFLLPVYGGTLQDGSIKNFMVGDNFILFLLVILLVLIPFITIFLFKTRPLQMKLVWMGILVAIVTIALTFMKASDFGAGKVLNFKAATFKVAAALPVLSLVMLFMAFGGIRKDQKLVKSVDRLR
ncbi:MAG: DUF4293 domain-containing protein [Chitinophagaceae bacterium]